MSRVVLSKMAKDDLRAIGKYIREHNEAAAKRWVQKLREVCTAPLVAFRNVARYETICCLACAVLRLATMFFRDRSPVEILRIVHGARDILALDFVDEQSH